MRRPSKKKKIGWKLLASSTASPGRVNLAAMGPDRQRLSRSPLVAGTGGRGKEAHYASRADGLGCGGAVGIEPHAELGHAGDGHAAQTRLDL